MDLRPQGPEIIRTWLFDSVVRSHFEHDGLPWAHAFINGWILDPDRKKMSKSRGNVVTPIQVLDDHGSDAVRYWACSARPGTDTALDVNQFKVGRRLAIKLLNASKFVLGLAGDEGGKVAAAGGASSSGGAVTAAVDLAMLGQLGALIDEATVAFEGYDYARALERTEAFFWDFCNDYLELVKNRAYGAAGDEAAVSARAALRWALAAILRLLAPFLPFVTEEVWSWWQEGSVHRAAWPVVAELGPAAEGGAGDAGVLDAAAWVLGRIRSAKSDRKLSMRAPVAAVTVTAPAEVLARLEQAAGDLREAGTVADLRLEPAPDGAEPAVVVDLADA